MLISDLLGSNTDIQSIASGGRTVHAPETSDTVALFQQALLSLGEYDLPIFGVDSSFGSEFSNAVVAFKTSRGLMPNDAVIGKGTSTRLDLEVAYLEGAVTPSITDKPRILALDPYRAGFLEHALGDSDLGQKVIDLFEFGNKVCMRLSLLVEPGIASWFGEAIVEPKVFTDFRSKMAPITSGDFFDDSKGSTKYVNFLLSRHPGKDPAKIAELGSKVRPDILRHRTSGSEWYEIKPMSIAGATAAWKKYREIPANYANIGLPYIPGTSYNPTKEIFLKSLITPEGENLDIILSLRRVAPALIFWTLCIKGDYIEYFNRVRLVAGMLAIMVALAQAAAAAAATAAEAAAATAVVSALVEIAAGLGLALPALNNAP
ncbi:peptidoglycan-binding domain-containing protein [Nocardia gipuzkoensis]